MSTDQAYAHTLSGQDKTHWEPLAKHLAEVAELASGFASAFHAEAWGEALGRWHDLGKYSDAFQHYIGRGDADAGEEETPAKNRIDHSTFGARHAYQTIPGLAGQLLAFCIAGHHSGLADATWLAESSKAGERSTLSFRLDENKNEIEPVLLPAEVAVPPKLMLPWPLGDIPAADTGFVAAFFGRMLFSCLIDADRTATEAFCDSDQASLRRRPKPSLDQLREALDSFLDAKQKSTDATPVNRLRRGVLADCLKAANELPGFFSLNVPTGGGKTFASLAFALHHAAAHRALRRVVVAIPFTSIIEQTADEYRKVFGSLSEMGLVEHHSNLNPKRDTLQNKLATENWDAPLIVTTNVQLYESLFASKTTPARKLHRLANSVIILDEAQTLPVDLLAPTLKALKELVTRYGCTVVLCTATQPALEWRERDFEIGIRNVRPIVRDADALYNALRRVTVERIGKIDDATLAARLVAELQVLCVVNTKAHAAKLYDRLAEECKSDCFHLSTFMCPQHRRNTLNKIRRLLAEKQPCRVISTQLIEAGVDVDFPCVYRGVAGFDSIAQAAGRCNREGELRDADGKLILGRVYVFDAETPPPCGFLRTAADVASEIAADYPNPILPDAIERYFSLLYWNQKRSHHWDKHALLHYFKYIASPKIVLPLQFKSAALAYQIISDEQTPVLVPYNKEARTLIDRLTKGELPDYQFYKAAQQYSVGVRDHILQQLARNAALVSYPEVGMWSVSENSYSIVKGLMADAIGLRAEMLVQ